MEVLEFGLNLTDGHNPSDAIPIASRLTLIRTWLGVKQMLQQALPKNLLPDKDLPESHSCHSYQKKSRAVAAVEVLRLVSLATPNPPPFKDIPTLQKAIQLVDQCQWENPIVRLEIYSQLAKFCTMPNLAGSGVNATADHSTAVRCAKMALETPSPKSPTKALKMSEANLRCQSAIVYGESLIRSEGVVTSVRLQSCKAFCDAVKFAAVSQDSYSAYSAMRQFWNNSLVLFKTAVGRKTLRQLLFEMLANVKMACKTADIAYVSFFFNLLQENIFSFFSTFSQTFN